MFVLFSCWVIDKIKKLCGSSLISSWWWITFLLCRPLAQQEFFTKPKFSHLIEPGDCLAAPCDVICLDMYTLQIKDLEVLIFPVLEIAAAITVTIMPKCWKKKKGYCSTSYMLFHFSGNKGSVSFLCGKVCCFPWIHRLVHCSFREPGDGRRSSGAKHRT